MGKIKLIVIRIRGKVNVAPNVKKTLYILRLRKKFSCVLIDNTPENIGKLRKVENYVSYGQAKEETIKKILLKRARLPGNKPLKEKKKIEAFVKEFIEGKKKLKDLGIKPFFSLHPPKGGFKKQTRKIFPEGILGKNEKINELVIRML